MEAPLTTVGEESLVSVTPHPGEYYLPWYPWLSVFHMIISLANVVGNSLTVYAYWTSSSLQKSFNNLLICNLSAVDLLVGFMGIPFALFQYTEAGVQFMSTNRFGCLMIICLTGITINLSLASIFLLCTERFIAVIFPYHYYTLVTDRLVRVAIATSYVVSVFIATPTLYGFDHWEPGELCSALNADPSVYISFKSTLRSAAIVATIFLNVIIVGVIISKRRKSVAPAKPSSEVPNPSLDQAQNGEGKQAQKSQEPTAGKATSTKVTKMLLAVFGIYYAGWMPYIIMTMLYKRNPDRSTAFVICLDLTKVLVGLNSCINPIIYAKGNEGFREAFKRILQPIYCRPAN